MTRRTTFFLTSSVAAAALLAAVFLFLLPEGGATAGVSFTSETALWMTGLLFVLFGAGSALGSLDLLRTPFPGVDAAQIPARDARVAPLVQATGSWWVTSTGILLLGVAIFIA